MRVVCCLMLLLAIAAGTPATPPCNDHTTYMAEIADLFPGGPALESGFTSLVVKGRKAYGFAQESFQSGALWVIDLVDESAPVLRGRLDLDTLARADALACLDHYVLLVTQDLLVIDVDDHDLPVEVLAIPASDPRDVVIYQRVAYLALAHGEVQVYDVDDPESPTLLTSVTTPFPARCLFVVDNLLLLGGENGMAVYSLADPTNPLHVGTLTVAGSVKALAAEGSLALASVSGRAHVIDIWDPTTPAVLAADFADRVQICALHDGLAWIGRDSSGKGGTFDRWSLADPTAPVRIGRDICHGYPHALAFAHGNVYTANWGFYSDGCEVEGLHVYRGGDPASPPRVGLLDIPGSSYGGSTLRGELLYMVGSTVLGIVDLSNPADPTPVSSMDFWPHYIGLDGLIVGNHLVARVMDSDFSDNWLQIYDLSDPLNPVIRITPAMDGSISARGDLLYVGRYGHDGIDVFTMLPSAELELLGSFWEDVGLVAPLFAGDRAALVDETHAIRLAEFTSPIDPVLLGSIPPPAGNAWRAPLAFEGDLVFTLRNGLFGDPPVDAWEIWDVSDPSAPSLQYSYDMIYEEDINDLAVRDGVLYVTDNRRITLWDIADPAAPVFLGDRPNTGLYYQSRFHLQPDYLVMTSYLGHVFTLPYQCVDATDVEDGSNVPAPASLVLSVAPNPFNPRTQLHFTLPEAAAVDLALYDLRGRRIRTMIQGPMAAGPHVVAWDGRDHAGRAAAAGVYLARLSAGAHEAAARLVLVR